MTCGRPPFVVIEGCPRWSVAQAEAEAANAGWTVVKGWSQAGPGVVCAATVRSEGDAVRAVLAALAGAGLVLDATAGRDVLDRMCDDLRHIAPVDHRLSTAPQVALTADERALLTLLVDGASLGDAAHALHLSRRTADRRLAHARRTLGASTTSEAVVTARRLGLRSPS